VQVGNPFLEKLLMEACLELARMDGVIAMQDLGAAGLTCALAELTARGGVGADVDLDAVPRREGRMTPYEVLLSESQERMLLVVRPEAVAGVRAVFDRYELPAAEIGHISDEPFIDCRAGGEQVCAVPGRALADDAPRYRISGRPSDLADVDLEPLGAEPASASVLLELLAGPNARDRKPIWRRYDHMNGTNTLVGPGVGDSAVLRIKGTSRALALAIDGPGPTRLGALDPYLAGASAVLEGALNVACSGATPIGVTDCLNFGSPEHDRGAWQLERAIDGIADACRVLGVPVVSGNVSLYNETADGPILPTPVVGTVGLIEDRATTLGMAWHAADELWLIGDIADTPDVLAASELAWRRGLRGGRAHLDLNGAAAAVRLVSRLARDGLVCAAHDASVGGIGVALARMAIRSAVGARVDIQSAWPTAALFGERAGRAIVAVEPSAADGLRAALDGAEVPGILIGTAAGETLDLRAGGSEISIGLDRLTEAWRTPF
jgi:phosphoribosylformylglycinamidine synthase